MKYYTTKYALTAGIEIHECELSDENGDYVYARGYKNHCFQQFIVNKTAFTSIEDAAAAAERTRQKKIAYLKKQISRLEKITIKMPEEAS